MAQSTPVPVGDAPLPEGEEKVAAVRSMFDTIAPRYDMVNRIMTFRMDVGWRKKTVEALDAAPGSVVLDLACGTGDFCRDIEAAGHTALGFDLSFGMLENARTTAPLTHGDALSLPVHDGAADGVTCGYALRNFRALEPFFVEMARVIKPGGRLAILEVSSPDNKVVGFGFNVYFGKVVPFIGGLLSDRSAYRYLPKSVAYLPPEHELLELIADAGFRDVRKQQLTGGLAQLLTATRTGG